MKKFYTLLFCLVFSSSLFLFAQEIYVEEENTEVAYEEPQVEENSKQESQGQLATKPFTIKDYAHWSVSIDGGINFFQGDMRNDWKTSFQNPLKHWSLGGNVEYTVNPMYSLGISYMYSSIAAHDNQAEQNGEKVDRGEFTSRIHHIAPFIGVNLLNFPMFNRNRNWDFWITAGLGAAYHNSELLYKHRPDMANNGTEEDWYNSDGGLGYSKRSEWEAFIPFTFEFSYNITKQFVIGLKYRVNLYMTDDIEGGIKLGDNDGYGRKSYLAGTADDALSNFLLTLRWDITPKDKTHIRKLSWGEFKQKPPRDPRIDDLARRLDELENQAADLEDQVADIKNAAPVMIPAPGADCKCDQVPLVVYFDFDRSNLDRDALIVINQVAHILKENPSYTVEVRGYTDEVGSVDYNNKLSQRRADAIKDELVKSFNIPSDRIIANGEGKATEPAPSDKKYHSINRRCDFFFIDGNKSEK